MKEKLKYDAQKKTVTIKYVIGDDTVTFKKNFISTYKSQRADSFNTFLNSCRKKVIGLVYGEDMARKANALNVHYVSWYPKPDREMMKYREEDVFGETNRLRKEMVTSINRVLRIGEVTEFGKKPLNPFTEPPLKETK